MAKKKSGGRSLNGPAWDVIFNELPILAGVDKDGHFDISAKEIKKHSGREARLMAKIDFKEHLPDVMKRNDLAILAIENGNYRIGRFDPFISIQPLSNKKSKFIPLPPHLLTLKPDALNSESAVLDAALTTGALEQVFGEKVILTVRGRTRCPAFSFQLGAVPFPVQGVQVEVDGGYEGKDTINLVEAKIGGRANLSLRQILYPHEMWSGKVGTAKKVRSYICFYQAPDVRIIPVVPGAAGWVPDHLQEVCFKFDKPSAFDIRSVVAKATPPQGRSFLQADSFDTVLAMFSTIAGAPEYGIEKDDLGAQFDIVPRQIDYYFSAIKWLGLAQTTEGRIELTDFGREVSAMSHADRLEALARIVFQDPLFHHVLHKPQVAVPDALFRHWGISGETRGRRVQTIRAWTKYFLEQTEV